MEEEDVGGVRNWRYKHGRHNLTRDNADGRTCSTLKVSPSKINFRFRISFVTATRMSFPFILHVWSSEWYKLPHANRSTTTTLQLGLPFDQLYQNFNDMLRRLCRRLDAVKVPGNGENGGCGWRVNFSAELSGLHSVPSVPMHTTPIHAPDEFVRVLELGLGNLTKVVP